MSGTETPASAPATGAGVSAEAWLRERGVGQVPQPADAGGDPSSAVAQPDGVGAAFAEILRRTSQRPQTEAELEAVLRRRYDDDVVAEALKRGRQAQAIDDAAFARAWVEDRGLKRGYGIARLRQELRRRQVPDPLAEAALEALAERDDLAAATKLAQRRASSFPTTLEPPAVARRLASFLMRRGYGQGLAQKVAADVSGLDAYRNWD